MDKKKCNKLISSFMGDETILDYDIDYNLLMGVVFKIFGIIETKEYKDVKPYIKSMDFEISPFYCDWIAWDERKHGDQNMEQHDMYMVKYKLKSIKLNNRYITKIYRCVVSFILWYTEK